MEGCVIIYIIYVCKGVKPSPPLSVTTPQSSLQTIYQPSTNHYDQIIIPIKSMQPDTNQN